MQITVLLKSAPGTDGADRALRTVSDMLAQGHSVNLFLLQEAVRFCTSHVKRSDSMDLRPWIESNLKVHVLTQDAKLRGIKLSPSTPPISDGSYESLVELLESSERVIGLF